MSIQKKQLLRKKIDPLARNKATNWLMGKRVAVIVLLLILTLFPCIVRDAALKQDRTPMVNPINTIIRF